MKFAGNHHLQWIGVVVGVLLLSCSAPGFAAKHALLIGINKYQQLPWLSGSRNDVDVMRGLLIEKFGFPETNIRVLLDEQATRSAIIGALREITEKTTPNDTIYVHYSGHGSQVKDLNGDEPDGLDETICPHDARTPGIPDITDDELQQILRDLKPAAAMVVLDSCHSGTALRSAASPIRIRSVPQDTRLALYQTGTMTTRGILPLPGTEPYVLFSAAAAHQEELDGPFGPNGQPLGLLTASLSRALQTTKRTATPRQVLQAVEHQVNVLKPVFAGHPVPEAQLEGRSALIDAPLFAPIGAANSAGATTASAPSPAQSSGTRRLLVKGEERRLLRRTLPRAIGGSVEWVDEPASADLVIDCASQEGCDVYGPQGVVRVARVAGQPGSQEVASRIAGIADSAPAIAELMLVDNMNASFEVNLSAQGMPERREQRQGERGIKLTASVANHQLRFYQLHDKRTHRNSLQLAVHATADCYLTLVSVDSAGTVTQLLPNALQHQAGYLPDGALEANRKTLIPDSLGPDNAAGFFMDYAPPAGTDTIRAICTKDLDTARQLRDEIGRMMRGAREASVGRVLVSSRGLTGLRPFEIPAGTNAVDWASATITVDISDAN